MNELLWVAEFRERLGAELGTRFVLATLATVDANGRPRARSVVCRAFETDGSVWLTSDARSDKNTQIRLVPFGELVIYLKTAREQYRLAGDLVAFSEGEARQKAWEEQSDATRAMFFWDEPGGPVQDDFAAPELVAASTPIPASFELLVLKPERVEHLDLKPHPHRRREWVAERGWAVRSINP